MNYFIALSQAQLEILLETVQAFVDNQKLLNLADIRGEVVALPLTAEAIKHLLTVFEQKRLDGKQEIHVQVEQLKEGTVQVVILMAGDVFTFEANQDEFHPL